MEECKMTVQQNLISGNLVFTKGIRKSFKKLSEEDRVKISVVLRNLSKNGINPEYFGSRLEPLKGIKYKGIYELKVKSLARKEWRFLIVQHPVEKEKVVVLHSFLKQSAEIKKVDKDKALTVAKQEEFL